MIYVHILNKSGRGALPKSFKAHNKVNHEVLWVGGACI